MPRDRQRAQPAAALRPQYRHGGPRNHPIEPGKRGSTPRASRATRAGGLHPTLVSRESATATHLQPSRTATGGSATGCAGTCHMGRRARGTTAMARSTALSLTVGRTQATAKPPCFGARRSAQRPWSPAQSTGGASTAGINDVDGRAAGAWRFGLRSCRVAQSSCFQGRPR